MSKHRFFYLLLLKQSGFRTPRRGRRDFHHLLIHIRRTTLREHSFPAPIADQNRTYTNACIYQMRERERKSLRLLRDVSGELLRLHRRSRKPRAFFFFLGFVSGSIVFWRLIRETLRLPLHLNYLRINFCVFWETVYLSR